MGEETGRFDGLAAGVLGMADGANVGSGHPERAERAANKMFRPVVPGFAIVENETLKELRSRNTNSILRFF